MREIGNQLLQHTVQAASRVGGGCDDPDCDCGGGSGEHGGGVAVSA